MRWGIHVATLYSLYRRNWLLALDTKWQCFSTILVHLLYCCCLPVTLYSLHLGTVSKSYLMQLFCWALRYSCFRRGRFIFKLLRYLFCLHCTAENPSARQSWLSSLFSALWL